MSSISRHYKSPEELIRSIGERMCSLDNKPVDGTAVTIMAQAVLDLTLLCKWQQAELRKLGVETDSNG